MVDLCGGGDIEKNDAFSEWKNLLLRRAVEQSISDLFSIKCGFSFPLGLI